MRKSVLIAVLGCFALGNAYAQKINTSTSSQTCSGGTTLSGTVRDTTLALVPGAIVVLDGKSQTVSGDDGTYKFTCVTDGTHKLSGTAEGFAKHEISVTTPRKGEQQLVLPLATVETNVQVEADNGIDPDGSAASTKISGDRLQTLADDPDDLLTELQNMAGAASGNPANTTIKVDGFQGASALPPKSSIAYIKVNPDMFAAQYNDPQFEGGSVEVYTKPGQKAYHGAIFTTNGSAWENARDPFALSKAAIGKQRYGAELSGPIMKTGSDFAMTFEHRIINDFAVVNAITLDSSGNQQPTIANVPTPQSLWLGTARSDWQLGAKNTFILSYSANVNSLNNQGVGGTTLAQAGYNAQTYEHMFRVSNVTTASASLMHETRLSLRWDGNNNQVESTAPQVAVAGAFTGGGASLGPAQVHELNIEFDDDAIFTTKHHTIMAGTQMMIYNEHQQVTNNFNGTYTFGGGTAPVLDSNNNPISGQTEIISGIEQYRRAILGYAGGTPTAYSAVTGTPGVAFVQVQNGLFVQDDWKIGHGLQFSSGLRWTTQNYPTTLNGAMPRLGLIYSPGKKNLWSLHAHYGMYTNTRPSSEEATLLGQDGITHITSTIYNPVYGNPTSGNPTMISSYRTQAPHLTDPMWEIDEIGGSRSLPKGWNLSLDYATGGIWNAIQSRNINAPLNDVPTGPRPGPANTNILQEQNSAKGHGNALFFSVEQHKLKHVQFFFGGVRVNLNFTSDDNISSTPQSATSEAGELAPQSGNRRWNLFGNGTIHLPKKIDWSINGYGGGDLRYNITTGYDNNGDGDFNDRPMIAAPGTPGAVQTPYGLLVDSGGVSVLPRNRGVQPWLVFMDTNMERKFTLTRNKKAEHQQVVIFNVRSSNVLNHTNVSAVGGVLGSPLFGVPYAAESGRRVEIGARYQF